MMEIPEEEALLLKSWDASLPADERNRIALLMQQDSKLRKQADQYLKIREMLKIIPFNSFGPFFAERVIHAMKLQQESLDYQILFFFKKYQLVLLGLLAVLVVLNVIRSEDLTWQSFFGLDEDTEDVFSIDVYKNLTE
jgi:hypothetical protein